MYKADSYAEEMLTLWPKEPEQEHNQSL